MKKFAGIALLAIASLATASNALAWDQAVKANVPFNFMAGNKQLPSGTYIISSASDGVIAIRGGDGRSRILLTAIAGHSNETNHQGKLVFHRYGDEYFLSEVVCSAADMNVHLPATKYEKRARYQEARLKSSGEVLVAAK